MNCLPSGLADLHTKSISNDMTGEKMAGAAIVASRCITVTGGGRARCTANIDSAFRHQGL